MKSYHVNEIFYSLQGEGFWTGRPAVFVRFSGCNLKCPFCDTVHNRSKVYTLDSLCEKVDGFNCNFVVLTGGEPSLSVDDSLVEALHKRNKFLAIETNGTQKLPENIDWITLSPKDAFVGNGKVILERANELKIVLKVLAILKSILISTLHLGIFNLVIWVMSCKIVWCLRR